MLLRSPNAKSIRINFFRFFTLTLFIPIDLEAIGHFRTVRIVNEIENGEQEEKSVNISCNNAFGICVFGFGRVGFFFRIRCKSPLIYVLAFIPLWSLIRVWCFFSFTWWASAVCVFINCFFYLAACHRTNQKSISVRSFLTGLLWPVCVCVCLHRLLYWTVRRKKNYIFFSPSIT